MAKLIIFIIYLLCGYICFKNGVDSYGGKDEYIRTQNISESYYALMCVVIMLIWPFLLVKAIILKIKENND